MRTNSRKYAVHMDLRIQEFIRGYEDPEKTVPCQVEYCVFLEPEPFVQIERIVYNCYDVSDLITDCHWKNLQESLLVAHGYSDDFEEVEID